MAITQTIFLINYLSIFYQDNVFEQYLLYFKIICIVQEGESSELWVEKYKPTNSRSIIGQQGDSSNMKKLTVWLTNWEKNHSGPGKKAGPKPPPWNSGSDNGFWAKAALLSGPPG